MTINDLHKLKRQDLLELLLTQSREVLSLNETIAAQAGTIGELEQLSDRLKEKLNDKDEQLSVLKDRLGDKDVQIGGLKEKLDDKDAAMERFKERLSDKDAQIERLKARLDQKDARIRELREGGKIKAGAEVSLKLEEIFDVAERAAERYLKEKLKEEGLVEELPPEEAGAEMMPGDIPAGNGAGALQNEESKKEKSNLWTKSKKRFL